MKILRKAYGMLEVSCKKANKPGKRGKVPLSVKCGVQGIHRTCDPGTRMLGLP